MAYKEDGKLTVLEQLGYKYYAAFVLLTNSLRG